MNWGNLMVFEFTVDELKKRGYLTVSGNCTIHDLEEVLRNFSGDEKLNPDFDLLTDFRDCVFEFKPDEMAHFYEIFNARPQSTKNRRSAILVSNPHETAVMFIHKMKMSETRTIEVFSTRDAALNWLNEETNN